MSGHLHTSFPFLDGCAYALGTTAALSATWTRLAQGSWDGAAWRALAAIVARMF